MREFWIHIIIILVLLIITIWASTRVIIRTAKYIDEKGGLSWAIERVWEGKPQEYKSKRRR